MTNLVEQELAAHEATFKAGWALALQWSGWDPADADALHQMMAEMDASWIEHELKIKARAE